MPSARTEATHPDGVAAARARHPAGRRRPAAPAGFADVVALLTGPWRVNDPDGFATAVTADPVIAGHPVSDTGRRGEPLAGALVGATMGAALRDLDVHWVAGAHDGLLFVEARAAAPAGPGGPELFVLAHVVEALTGGGPRRSAAADHSWAVLVCGDGAGGVAGILRATLSCPGPRRCCPTPCADVRLPLVALRERLVAAALLAERPAAPADRAVQIATVVPFRSRRPAPPGPAPAGDRPERGRAYAPSSSPAGPPTEVSR